MRQRPNTRGGKLRRPAVQLETSTRKGASPPQRKSTARLQLGRRTTAVRQRTEDAHRDGRTLSLTVRSDVQLTRRSASHSSRCESTLASCSCRVALGATADSIREPTGTPPRPYDSSYRHPGAATVPHRSRRSTRLKERRRRTGARKPCEGSFSGGARIETSVHNLPPSLRFDQANATPTPDLRGTSSSVHTSAGRARVSHRMGREGRQSTARVEPTLGQEGHRSPERSPVELP